MLRRSVWTCETADQKHDSLSFQSNCVSVALRNVEESSEARVSVWTDSPAARAASPWLHIKSPDGQKRRESPSTSWRKGWVMISFLAFPAQLPGGSYREKGDSGRWAQCSSRGFLIDPVFPAIQPMCFSERPPLRRTQWKHQHANKVDAPNTNEANV